MGGFIAHRPGSHFDIFWSGPGSTYLRLIGRDSDISASIEPEAHATRSDRAASPLPISPRQCALPLR
jgi:hypothetical protein